MNLEDKYSYCHPTKIPLSNHILDLHFNNSDPYIQMLLASLISDNKMFYDMYQKNDPLINWGLSQNPHLHDAINGPYTSFFNFDRIISASPVMIEKEKLNELLNDSSLRILLANNPLIDQKDLNLLCTYQSHDIFSELAKNKLITPFIIEFLMENGSEKTLFTLASNDKISEEQMIKFSKSPSEYIRSGLALNKNITYDIKSLLIKDPFCIVKKHLVYNESLTDEEMKQLSRDKNIDVRKNVAWRTNNQEILESFIQEIDYEIREIIARKVKCINSIYTLSLTNNQNILRSLVLNPNTTSEIIAKLIHKNLDFTILEELVHHPNSSEDIHSYLCLLDKKDLNELLARLSPYPNIIEIVYNKCFKEKQMRSIMAMNKATPKKILDQIYDYNDDSSKFLTTNPNLPDDLLNKILENPSFTMDSWVNLARYCTNESVLWALFFKDKDKIHEALAMNDESPAILLAQIPDKYLKIKRNNKSWKDDLDIAIMSLEG